MSQALVVKKIRNTLADSKLKTGSFLDLTVEEDSILTPISTNTVRYYGRDGLSDVFDILADNQETEQRYNLALVGPPGVGKSNLVWAVADHLAGKKGKSALWVSHRVFGEKWTVRRFIPDKGVFGITGCPLLLSDILELDVANVDVLILDAPTNADDNTSIDGIAAFEWATKDSTRIEYRRVIHVSSLGAFTNKSTIADNFHVREIRMRTWTRQDFVEAVADKVLGDRVRSTLEVKDASKETAERLVDAKFYFSGINARWFFNLPIRCIKKECRTIIERLDPDTIHRGNTHKLAVNSALSTFWEDDRQVMLFTSSYLARLMGQGQKQQDEFLKLYPLMKNRLGNGAPGEIFELDFALSLQHCHDLATAQRAVMGEKAQSVSMRLGVNILDKQEVLWPTGRLLALPPAPTDPTTLQPMPTNACSTDKVPQWFVPVSKSQPFLDFFVLIPEKNGKWQFRAIQITVSKTHSTDLSQLKRVVGGVLQAGFSLDCTLVVAYVIEKPDRQNKIAKGMHGTNIDISMSTEKTRSTGSQSHIFTIKTLLLAFTRTGSTPN